MSDEKEALVSVIVPVYKTEKYLEDCMRSILQQDYPAAYLHPSAFPSPASAT